MAASGPAGAGRIFISYRRADAAYPAGWLFERLAEHFGRHQVFKDVDSIQLGDDFAEVIADAVASCDVLLVLIGHKWLTITGEDGNRRLNDPDDFVRLEIESALTLGVRVIPVLIDGARMPRPGELPPSLTGLVRRQSLELSPSRFDFDIGRLLRVLDQSIAEARAAGGRPAYRQRQARREPVRQEPGAQEPGVQEPGAQEPAVQEPAKGGPAKGGPGGPRRSARPRTLIAAASGGVAVAVIVALVALMPGGGTGQAPPAGGGGTSSAPTASSAAASRVIVTDDFSGRGVGWVVDDSGTAGRYLAGAYRLEVTGTDGDAEFARPDAAADGLGGDTSLSLSVSVDARKAAGAAGGYGYGIVFRNDGHGNEYALVIEDHAVAIQKWAGGHARVQGSPAPVSTGVVHADAVDHLKAVCATEEDGQAVHLELWVNGQKLVDFTDRDHPFVKGYLGLYVETNTATATTAGADFDNFVASEL